MAVTKKKNAFTIMVMSERSTRVRKVVVPGRVARYGLLAAGAIGLIAAGVTTEFVRDRFRSSEIRQIRAENRKYRAEVENLRTKISTVEAYLARLRRFDVKLRSMAQVEELDRHVALGPLEVPGDAGGVLTASLGHDMMVPDLGGAEASQRAMEALNRTLESLDKIESEAAERLGSMGDLDTRLSQMGNVLQHTPSLLPTSGWITSHFGFRPSPYTGARHMHEGMDIAAKPGTPVISPADGIVTFVGPYQNYGTTVVLNHGNGTITRYGHLQSASVSMGDQVKRGGTIGLVGNSGRSTGPHLHYEVVVDGIPRDPRNFVLNL